MNQLNPQAWDIAAGHLPTGRHLRRPAEAHCQRAPGRLRISGAKGGEPGGIAREHSHEIDIASECSQNGGAGAIGQPTFHRDRLHAAQRPGSR